MAIGGGSGLSVLLRGLKAHCPSADPSRLTGVVTVTDDGGSSGRLRREFGVPPPGDIRNCLVALADDEAVMARLFQYRFPNGQGLSGHSFGNLFLTALTGISGDFYQAVLTAESVLSVRGRILPSTLTDVRLKARGQSGRLYMGESAVGRSGEPLMDLELQPLAPPAFPAAAAAVRSADLVILGPGSLYTSILPNLLIPGIRRALHESAARVVLVLNLMTQPGETDGMDAVAHLDAIERHAGPGCVDCVIVHSGRLPRKRVAYYAEAGACPVEVDRGEIERRGIEVREADLVGADELIRHDSGRLAEAVLGLCRVK